jgi:iron complex transport system permease protein
MNALTINKNALWVNFILALAVLGVVLFALGHGQVKLSLAQVWSGLLGAGDLVHTQIVWEIRLPRLATAVIAGAALGIAGVLMQSLFRNPMADAWSLGLTAGGQLGVALLVAAMAFSGPAALDFLAKIEGLSLSVGAGLGVAAVALAMSALAKRLGAVTLMVVGLMLWFTAQGLVSVVLHFANRVGGRVYAGWNDGTFASVTFADFPTLLPPTLLGIALAVFVAKGLTALQLGEAYATSLGTPVPQLRRWTLAAVVLLVAPVTAYCGPVIFIGLIVPHFARALAGSARVMTVLPLAALCGALMALLADAIVNAPWEQHFLHLNAVLALIGAPVVIAMLVGLRSMRTAA